MEPSIGNYQPQPPPPPYTEKAYAIPIVNDARPLPSSIPPPQPPPPPPSTSIDTDQIIEILLILFFPPLAIWFHAKECTSHICLNICLMFFFVIPALVHALWYCFMRR